MPAQVKGKKVVFIFKIFFVGKPCRGATGEAVDKHECLAIGLKVICSVSNTARLQKTLFHVVLEYMKISFVIPAHNEEKLIGKCLESVKRELANGSYDSEVIVVNNASTDGTREAALKFKGGVCRFSGRVGRKCRCRHYIAEWVVAKSNE